MIGEKGSKTVDEKATPGDNPEWFSEASLNWAENQLRYAEDPSRKDQVAIIQGQEGAPGVDFNPERKQISWVELKKSVGKLQRSMKAMGVKKGDTVAFWGGNCMVSFTVWISAIKTSLTLKRKQSSYSWLHLR